MVLTTRGKEFLQPLNLPTDIHIQIVIEQTVNIREGLPGFLETELETITTTMNIKIIMTLYTI